MKLEDGEKIPHASDYSEITVSINFTRNPILNGTSKVNTVGCEKSPKKGTLSGKIPGSILLCFV